MNTMENLPALITVYYLAVLGFFLGWAMPRGKHLKFVQKKTISIIYNFFVDETDYITKKVNRVRKKG